ncbi:MAG: isoprenylcysteine carboxylmethyltransferase family protein [Rhodothermales bacterium]|nr:isoprenylcysteine carboxylmethyltransferase family protein [Rhodothermales bacterium]
MVSSSESPRKSPGIHYPPPLIFVIGFGLGGLINRWLPISLGIGESKIVGVVAIAIAVVGVSLTGISIIIFLKNRTPVYPNSPARKLVVTGPYRFTRNPMYTGLTLLYLGGTLMVNSLWPLVMLPAVLFSIYRLVIVREEKHLHDTFGNAYGDYTSKVRRWI